MEATAIAAATPTASITRDPGLDALTSEDFFQLLITEMQQQDPLSPTETSDMVAQIADIRTIEQSQQLSDALSQLADQQRAAGTSDLLGKYITATVTDAEGDSYQYGGIVTGVFFDANGSAVLELDTGATVLASDVAQIMTPEEAEARLTAAAGAADAADDSEKTQQTARPRNFGPWGALGELFGL